MRGTWRLLWRWSATATAVPSRGLGQGALDADELLGQSSLLGAARGGWDRRRLGGATDANQTAVREKKGSAARRTSDKLRKVIEGESSLRGLKRKRFG